MESLKVHHIGKQFVHQLNNTSAFEHENIYDENVEFISSLTQRLIHDTFGKIKGNKTLIAYWDLIKAKYPDFEMIHLDSSWYNNKIVIHLSIPPFSNNALGIISLNEKNKISSFKLSHV